MTWEQMVQRPLSVAHIYRLIQCSCRMFVLGTFAFDGAFLLANVTADTSIPGGAAYSNAASSSRQQGFPTTTSVWPLFATTWRSRPATFFALVPPIPPPPTCCRPRPPGQIG